MTEAQQQEVVEEELFVYGRYTVEQTNGKTLDSDGNPINFLVRNDQLGCYEARTSSLPQAMSIAVGLDRAIEQIIQDTGLAEDTPPEDSLLN